MIATAFAQLMAPATLVATLAAGLAATPAGRAGAAHADPVAGTRSIAMAHGSVAPECLTVDAKGRAAVAPLCFKEGADHSWSIRPVAGAPGSYVLALGLDCLTLDPTRSPDLVALPCERAHPAQVWQISGRDPGEYQLAIDSVCIQARSADVTTAPCMRGKDLFGVDDSGQAWKILKDPQSVVPDPSGGRPRPD